jgi:hypothetical protein
MAYLNLDCLHALDVTEFRERKPYPWINPSGFLLDSGYQRLVDALPDVAIFKKAFAQKRKHGQAPHDRFVLEYEQSTQLPGPWREFLDELQQPLYRGFLQRSFGVSQVAMRFHWLYTPTGCSVSPHCDGANELGTHLFYFNTPADWDAEWGGATLILDDGQKLMPNGAPSFDSFDAETAAQSVGNYSLLFARTDHSWHGVRELRCPEGQMRKLFSVIVSRDKTAERGAHWWSRPRYSYF